MFLPFSKGGEGMATIIVREDEEFDHALKRFKKECQKSGIISDIKKHEYYEKPSERRKRKLIAAQIKKKSRGIY